MSHELVFVTANAHKLEEVQLLTGNNFNLKGLADLDFHDDISETGLTFQENASIKSNHIYSRFKKNCFADDSGLEVDALNGEPGIWSARYSGSRDTNKNLHLVLNRLTGVTNRKARFRCVISLILNGIEYFFEGTIEGTILTQPTGLAGFGYDPVFRPDGYRESFAEMPLVEKNRISHRGKAISKLVEFLNTQSF